MDDLGHPVWDADNHYYEALDAFTRHLDPALGPRTVQWATIEGRQYHVLGGKVSRAVTNATFDPISKPGCLSEYFRGNPNHVNPLELIRDHEPIRPEYRDPGRAPARARRAGPRRVLPLPDARDDLRGAAQGRPRGGVHHLPRLQPVARRGLALRLRGPHPHRRPTSRSPTPTGRSRSSSGRSTPGARMIVMRPAAPTTDTGRCSPFDARFDPFWARVDEAGHHRRRPRRRQRPVVQRLRGRRLRRQLPLRWLRPDDQELPHRGGDPRLPPLDDAGRALQEVPEPADRVGRERRRVPPRPVPQAPLAGQEDARAGSARTRSTSSAGTSGSTRSGRTTSTPWSSLMGADRVIFGSDWPHIEGLAHPLDYVPETKALSHRRTAGSCSTTTPSPWPRPRCASPDEVIAAPPGVSCASGHGAECAANLHARHLPCSRSRGVGSSRRHRQRGAKGDARSRSRRMALDARAADGRDRGQPRRRQHPRGARARPGGRRHRGRAGAARGGLRPAARVHRQRRPRAHPHRRPHRRDPPPGLVGGRARSWCGPAVPTSSPTRTPTWPTGSRPSAGPSLGWAVHADVVLPNGLKAAALSIPVEEALGWLVVAVGGGQGDEDGVGASVRWLGRVAVAAVRLVAHGPHRPEPPHPPPPRGQGDGPQRAVVPGARRRGRDHPAGRRDARAGVGAVPQGPAHRHPRGDRRGRRRHRPRGRREARAAGHAAGDPQRRRRRRGLRRPPRRHAVHGPDPGRRRGVQAPRPVGPPGERRRQDHPRHPARPARHGRRLVPPRARPRRRGRAAADRAGAHRQQAHAAPRRRDRPARADLRQARPGRAASAAARCT